METFDPGLLCSLETMSHTNARDISLNLIKSSKTKDLKKAALIRDIQAASSSQEISRIMWNVLLAGEGLAITTSQWQIHYGGKKK